MNDAGESAFPHFIRQYGGSVSLRITCVNNDRQARFARSLDMFAKPSALLGAVAFVIIIIQTGLAYGNNTRMR